MVNGECKMQSVAKKETAAAQEEKDQREQLQVGQAPDAPR
jgi:hypothetical protein